MCRQKRKKMEDRECRVEEPEADQGAIVVRGVVGLGSNLFLEKLTRISSSLKCLYVHVIIKGINIKIIFTCV